MSITSPAGAAQTPASDGGSLTAPTFAKATTARPATFVDGNYIVITRDAGATSDPATAAPSGKKFNAHTAAVRTKQQQLRGKHSALAASVGAVTVRNYTLSMSGFAARLTAKQAQDLSANKDVLAVVPDEARSVDTWHTPTFLGLDGPSGVWNAVGGVAAAGDGIVVGDIDSGAWPESASFAAPALPASPTGKWGIVKNANGGATMKKADGGTFTGVCQPGDQWTADNCNQKIVGARYYPNAFIANVPQNHWSPTEVISARDGGGHGTHTASTAVGNNGVPMTVEGVNFGTGSGMAPAAKLAVYKVCFDDDDPNTGGCYTSSTLSAIDDAISDGVDVLNFSISGATTTVVDAVEVAFEGAAEAGIFVAASAGNSGPTASTVAHNSPWLTTVANSTHYAFEGTLVLGNGMKYKGASVNRTPVGQTPMIDAATAGLPGVDPLAAKRCYLNALDPTKVSGKMVVCARGVNARVEKSAEVKRAGGVAMVLANVSPNSLDADFHSVPSVHISDTDGAAVYSYLGTSNPTGAIEVGDTTGGTKTAVPQISASSSRGPALANGSDLLKPDIAAPGTAVLAAVAPPSNSNRNFDLYTGTSMAAPHISGLAALYLGVHPNWSPMAVKSAMMTTAYDLLGPDGTKLADPFAQGAGHVNPTKFLNPGLLVLSGPADWRGFLTGQGFNTGVPAISATDFNGPSIAKSQVAGSFTTTRVFTPVMTGKWNVSVNVPGFSATYRNALPITRLDKTQKVEVTFTRTTAPIGQWATGFMTLTGPTTVRLPIALRPVSVAVPPEVSGTGTTGSVAIPLVAGMTGPLAIGVDGLAKGSVTAGSLATGSAKQVVVPVAAGSTFARFDLDTGPADADFDLYVYRCAPGCALVGQSATGSADERVDITNPAPGTYVALVDGYDAGPGRTAAAYAFTSYVLNPATNTGAFTVTPNPVTLTQGATATVTASWSGLTAGVPYLGKLSYAGAISPTIVTVR